MLAVFLAHPASPPPALLVDAGAPVETPLMAS